MASGRWKKCGAYVSDRECVANLVMYEYMYWKVIRWCHWNFSVT